METSLKTGFAKFSLAAPKSELPKIWGGGGKLQPPSPRRRPVAYALGGLSLRTLQQNRTQLGLLYLLSENPWLMFNQ